MTTDFDSVLQMAQVMLQNEAGEAPVTTELIAAAVDQVLGIQARWQTTVDRSRVIAQLETRFRIWIGREQVLASDTGHLPWLDAVRKAARRYWPRYREWLDATWSPRAVDGVDAFTDRILGLLEDPDRTGAWDRRGLVVGHIQSGKTANYIGLICKAADAGYKVIIVLAGAHKSLRSQTQMRLDEGFLGYETLPQRRGSDSGRTPIGVGLRDRDPAIMPDYLTNRSDSGDFSRAVANNAGITPGKRPLLFVVKKNAKVLSNLLAWVEERVANAQEPGTGRRVVKDIPLLMIDDEADHYSVDTGEQGFDQEGNLDPDYDPKRINRIIRRLLFCFEKSAYVGYTATPFANIFIHEKGATADEGEDLFPRSFIINLPAPSNYCGPELIFGLDGETGSEPLGLVRHVADYATSLDTNERHGWMPMRHRSGHVPIYNGVDEIPPSLQEAIQAFLLAVAVRRVRDPEPHHHSMLIHVTRYQAVQTEVRRQVGEYLASLKRRLVYGDGSAETAVDAIKQLWERDFVPTTRQVRDATGDDSIANVAWKEIEALLPQVVQDVHIRQIDGSAGDILDYEVHKEKGFTVIAIGGDKLSRGLTLEGLSISYFLRASRMYDTLMQMGRWFGYRPAYLDLCRLYTTEELEEWFEHITDASIELRQEFDHMAAIGGTPRDYGLKVQSHPVLLATSRVKMRNSMQLRLSFSGAIQETVVFHRNMATLRANLSATDRLVSRMGKPTESSPERDRGGRLNRWSGSFLWSGVPADQVVEFLRGYATHESAVTVNCAVLADFVERKANEGELNVWTVALLSGETKTGALTIAGLTVNKILRELNPRIPRDEQESQGRVVIRRLLAPRDEAIDLDASEYGAALALSVEEFERSGGSSRRKERPSEPSGIHIRHIRGLGSPDGTIIGHPERGLMLLYPLTPRPAGLAFPDAIIGFGLSFPASHTTTTVSYTVNNTYWAQEAGGEL